MEKQTKILVIAALIIAGLFYWNKQSVSDKKAIEDKATGEKLAAEKTAADKVASEKAAAAEKENLAEKALAEWMNTSTVSIIRYQKYVMNPLEYNPNEDVQDYVVIKIPKQQPNDYFYSLRLTELDSNMNKVGTPQYYDDGSWITDTVKGYWEGTLYLKPDTKYEGLITVLQNAGYENEQSVIRNKFIYSPNNIVNENSFGKYI